MIHFNPQRSARETGSRRGVRASLFLNATIRRKGISAGEELPVRIRNLSSVGVMADYKQPIECGEDVVVTCSGLGSVAGRVAWVSGQIGIAFDYEVDPLKARRTVRRRPEDWLPVPPL
jgi:hypothetical protein